MLDGVAPLEKGAAIDRMREIAKSIYLSTPRIADQLPKHASKILSNCKDKDLGHDEERGTVRASLFISAETVKLAKQGRVQNRDLAIEVCAQDWHNKYETILAKFELEREEAFDLRTTLIKKQQLYIQREQEYRDTIQKIKMQVDEQSKKTFLLAKENTDETLELEGGVKLELQRPPPEDLAEQEKLRTDGVHRDPPKIKAINLALEQISQSIQEMHNQTNEKLAHNRKQMWAQLHKNLEEYKDKIREEEEKQKAQEVGKEQEKSNRETLELMSVMAQRIDEDN